MSTPQLLSVPEAAVLLGMRPKGVWSLVYSGRLGSVRVFGSRKIELATIERVIEDGRTESGTLPKPAKNTKPGPGRPRKVKSVSHPEISTLITAVQTEVPTKKVGFSGWLSGPAAVARIREELAAQKAVMNEK